MPFGWLWVLIAVVIIAIPIIVIVAIIIAMSKRRAVPPGATTPQLAPMPVQLEQADQLLAAGRIDPAEHAAMRNRILGITD